MPHPLGGRDRSGAKTRRLPCRRPRRAGTTSGECLGCAGRWGKDRTGNDPLQRRTARQKLRNALQRCPAWGKEPRHLRLSVRFPRRHATRRGYDHDDGVHGNAASLPQCFNRAMRMVLKGRNRRRQRHRDPWQGSKDVLEGCKVARPRIVGRPKTRQATLKT